MEYTVIIMLSTLIIIIIVAVWQQRNYEKDFQSFVNEIMRREGKVTVHIEFNESDKESILKHISTISRMIEEGARSGTVRNDKGEEIGKWSI